MMGMNLKMTTNSNEKTEKTTMDEHVAETHRNTPIVGNVVTGDIVGGEVSKDDEDGDESTD
jgi:hypothetical protein